jgi:serine protease Do
MKFSNQSMPGVFQRTLFLCILFVLVPNIIYSSASKSEINNLKRQSSAFNKVAERAIPAVVHISTEKTVKLKSYPYHQFFGFLEEDDFYREFFQMPTKEYRQQGLGSGVIVSEEGYIITNYHVVKGMDTITVTLSDGREFLASVIGHDVKKDMSLLKIDAKEIPVIELSNSDKIEVGDWAIAIGSPFGLSGTLTVGVISAKSRSEKEAKGFGRLIQTDAAINPGNSGGALLNIDGQLIGINTAIVTSAGGYLGIGFAIPINDAKIIMEKILNESKKRGQIGWLGLSTQEINKDLHFQLGLSSKYGVLVNNITDKGPASKAGLMRGDILIEINGEKIFRPYEVKEHLLNKKIDEHLKIAIIRKNKIFYFNVKIEKQQKKKINTAINNIDNIFGLKIENISKETTKKYDLFDSEGVVITYIKKNGAAYRAGLHAGDIILEINRYPINSKIDYEKELKKISESKKILALIKTPDYSRYVVLRAGKLPN